MKTVDDIGEDKLTALFAEWLSADSGRQSLIGDDVAVIPDCEVERDLLFTSDSVIEGIHILSETPPEAIGRKAVNRCLSDIAAMGGEPKHLLLNLTLPGNTPIEWVERLMRSAGEAAQVFSADIVGGDLARFDTRQVHVFLAGQVPAGEALTRSGANTGDQLFVTGRLGGSLAGHHLDFTPRVSEGGWLRDHAPVSAMMDLSDGLGSDLPRLLAASGVGAEISIAALPLSTEAKGWESALFDGEDYELLFAAPEDQGPKWIESFCDTFSCGVTPIGKVTECTNGLRWLEASGKVVDVSGSGYQHFTTDRD